MERFVELCTQGSKSVDREEQVRIVQSLLENEELDPGKRDKNGFYPIHYAAQYGRLEIVDLLLLYCDPHLTSRGSKLTALHVACSNNRLDVVQALLQHCQKGAPPKQDKDGNTPLHLACNIGSLEITNRLLGKYPTGSIYEANKRGVTPLGYAVAGNHSAVAKHLVSLSSGNPAHKFADFRQNFPTFKHEQSLDHPVSIFVMGNRRTGKSTLIKSVQVEGYFNRTLGVIINTPGVDRLYGGVVPSDVSSYGYGRVKFYELAGCRQSTQENIFLSLAEPAHSLFLIILSFKDEQKEMEANLLYWLSFIHHQYRSIEIKPCVAVVGSFLFYQKLGAIRLDNRHRLHLVYHHVLNSHSELCSHFHFLGKYSMDCRKCESPGLRQLRSMLARKCREMRPSGGEKNVPSSCYVLFSALHDIRPPISGIPALNLSEIEYHISQNDSKGQSSSLLSLLPASVEDLTPFLETLEERKAIVTIKHLDPRDPCVIYDEYELLSQIDSSLVKRFIQVSQTSYFNPAIMHVEKLQECLSTVPLSKEVLLNILHCFKISDHLSHGNSSKYFLPSVLHITHYPNHPLTWEPDDSYAFGFAWCIVPQSSQVAPCFMPRFLYFMLCELFTSTEGGDIEKVIMSESGLYCKQASELEVYITIDSSMVNLHMRCKKGEEVTCLKYRNTFLSAIHQQRELLQPNLKVNEYIIPMGVMQFPVQKVKHIKAHGRLVSELKNAVVTASTNESVQNELCFEPLIWCKNLKKANLQCLLDSSRNNVPVSQEFLQDLSQHMEGKWEAVADATDLLEIESDNNGSAEEHEDEESGTKCEIQDPQIPQYGQILEFFSTMSLFRSKSQFLSALKNPQQYSKQVSQSQDELNEIEAVNVFQPTIQVMQPESVSEYPPSSKSPSTSSTSQDIAAYNHSPYLKVRDRHPQPDVVTCSSTSEISSQLSHMDVPEVEGEKCSNSTPYNVHFINATEQIQCSSSGAKFQSKVHGIAFYVPPGAVSDGSYMILEYGVAIAGPFLYPDNIMPVSPILWVEVQCNGGELKMPIEITIPHAVNCNEGSSLLHFMCASKQKHQVTFRRTHKQAMFGPKKGTLLSKLSKWQYFFCIGGKFCREIIAKIEYCIIQVTPRQSIEDTWKIHFFITYFLPACNELVRQQFGENYTMSARSFHFDTSDGKKPSVDIDFQRILPEKWTIMKEGTYQQIEPTQIDFGKFNFQTGDMNIHHIYPPSFTIAIEGHRAVQESFATFEFKGTLPTDLVYEVPLTFGPLHHHPLEKTGSSSQMQKTIIPRQCSVGNLSTESGKSTYSMSKETDKEIMSILVDNFTYILNHLDQREIRPVLFEQKALSDSEYEKLLSLSNGNEQLLLMIKKKGIKGFKQLLIALEKTSDNNIGHHEILDTLKTILQQHQLPYAAQLLSTLST